jgi:hypothetical protein
MGIIIFKGLTARRLCKLFGVIGLIINLMLSLHSQLALCLSNSCCIDSRPIHVNFDGSPQALIKKLEER